MFYLFQFTILDDLKCSKLMFKQILCIFSLAISACCTNVSAQILTNTCSTIYCALGNTFQDAAYLGSKIIVIGDYGKIILSENDGADWKYVQSATNEHLGDIQMVTPDIGYIASTNGVLLKTEDGGNNWFPLQPGEQRTMQFRGYRIYFLSATVGYHYGQGRCFKTIDGGRSWTEVPLGLQGGSLFDMSFINESVGIVCGDGGVLARTTDGGTSWQRINPGGLGTAKLTSIVFVNATTGFLADDSGDIMKSTDAGLTWSRVGITGAWVNRLLFLDEQNAYAMAGSDLRKTTDGGVTWKAEDDGSGIQNVAFNPASKKYVGIGSGLMRLKNNSDPWVTKSELGFLTLHDRMFFPDDMTGYLFKSSEQNYKTVDGGITWKRMRFAEDYHESTTAVHFFSKDVGLYTSEKNIFSTTDGAKTWKKPTISDYSPATVMTFANNKIGYMGTDKRIYKTLDAGLSWQGIYELPANRHISKLQFPSVNVGYSLYSDFDGTADNRLYKTVDQGSTWKAITVPGEPRLGAIYFFDEQSGFVTAQGALYKTENGGDSWTRINFDNLSISNISFHDRLHGFINAQHRIFETFDGGQTWTYATNTRWDAIHWNTINGETYILDKDGEVTKIPRTGSPAQISGYISGENIVPANTTQIYKGLQTPGISYNWTVSGSATVVSDSSEASVTFKEPGEYQLTATPSNACGVGPGRTLSVTVVPAIAANNFAVSIRGLTCKGSKNGSLTIKALQKLNYKLSVKDPGGAVKNYTFDDELSIPGLDAGSYELSFTIDGYSVFTRKQKIVIDEPKDLSVYSSLKTEGRVLHLDLEGGEKYRIELNGKRYQTSNATFDLELATGVNKVLVSTDQICQGVFEQEIVLSGVTIYPNPVVAELKIDLGVTDVKEMSFELRNILGASLIAKKYVVNGSTVSVDMGSFAAGTYILTLKLGNATSIHKIIKQ
jgi:photosystem II stability/assembly factor-like uncharacterized protein